MTDFNNSSAVPPRGPLTPPHKRKHLLSFHSAATETSSRANISQSFPWQPQRANTHTRALTTSAVKISFYSVRDKKPVETGAKFHVIHIQHHPAVEIRRACLIKLAHTATGGGVTGSRLHSNRYLFVNSEIAA